MDCIADFLLTYTRQLKLLKDYEMMIDHAYKSLSLFKTECTKEIT